MQHHLHLKKLKIIFLGIFGGINWNVNNFQVPYLPKKKALRMDFKYCYCTLSGLPLSSAFCPIFSSCGSYLNLYWSITI